MYGEASEYTCTQTDMHSSSAFRHSEDQRDVPLPENKIEARKTKKFVTTATSSAVCGYF